MKRILLLWLGLVDWLVDLDELVDRVGGVLGDFPRSLLFPMIDRWRSRLREALMPD